MGKSSSHHPLARSENQATAFNELLDVVAVEPREIFNRLCETWRRAVDARWTGLWLYNPSATAGGKGDASGQAEGSFQLNGVSVGDITLKFDRRPEPGAFSIGDWVTQRGTTSEPHVEFVENVRGWSKRDRKGNEYGVHLAEQLDAAGTPALVCISFRSVQPDEEAKPVRDDERTFSGLISLHFDRLPGRLESSACRNAMRWMARLTATAVAKRNLDRQVEVARHLSHLMQDHLTRFDDRPNRVRADYAMGLRDLLRSELEVEMVSIFWRDAFDFRELECLASTQLRQTETGQTFFRREDMPNVRYRVGDDQWTSHVFETGQMLLDLHLDSHEPKYIDDLSKGGPRLILPVPFESAGWKSEDAPTFGVIRCGNPAANGPLEGLRVFDAPEIRTLQFVADQISPVLRTFESRILRESTIAVVRHDLLAPLVMIRNAATELHDSLFHVASRGDRLYLENLSESALRLGSLADMLAIGAIEKPRYGKVDMLKDIIAPLKRMITPFALETSRMTVHFSASIETLPPVNVDSLLITRALYNLLTNAIKYGERSTRIDITGKTMESGDVCIDVKNQGMGIDPDEKESIWRPYFRGRKAAATRDGSGLGLAIVCRIMRDHGGSLRLARPSKPTIFRLMIPQHRVLKTTQKPRGGRNE